MHGRGRRRAVATLLALGLVSASVLPGYANSTYRRRDERLLAMRMRSGMPVLERNGRVFDADFFGGSLEAAVAGNDEAVAHAQLARDSMWAFLGTYLGGLGLMLVGAPVAGVSASNGEGMALPGVLTGVSLTTLGFIGVCSSIYFATRAQAAQLDAITAFNDGVILDLQRRMSSGPLPNPAMPTAPSGAEPPPATPDAAAPTPAPDARDETPQSPAGSPP